MVFLQLNARCFCNCACYAQCLNRKGSCMVVRCNTVPERVQYQDLSGILPTVWRY